MHQVNNLIIVYFTDVTSVRYLTFGTILAGIGLGEADAFRLVFVDGVIS